MSLTDATIKISEEERKLKIFNKKDVPSLLFLISLIIIFFITRFINLTIIPIFTDEAIYLRWAQIALSDPRWRFISLIDGKQPLLIWLFLPALKLINDPLVAGRVVSVIAGFLGFLGIAVFSRVLTQSMKGAVIGALLYLVIPFFLMYDRLALYDALLTTISIWTLFLSYLYAKKQQLDLALLLGTAIGAGLLTKSSANFFLYLLPVSLILVDWKKNRRQKLFKWLGLSFVVIIQSQIYNNILRLSEFRHVVAQKNLTFIYSFSDFFSNPFLSVGGNLKGLTSWLVGYLTLPLTIVIIISIIWYLRKNFREAIFFLSYFLVPFMALAFFGRIIYPRFIIFMVPPLMIMMTVFILHLWSESKNRHLFLLVSLLVLLPALNFNFKTLTDPIHAPMPLADRQQLINDWPAGYGIREIVLFFREEAKNKSIIVGTEGTFGLFPMALELYLGKDPNITFKPYWPLNEFPDELIRFASEKPTFLVFKERQQVPKEQNWPINLINEYQRGDGPTYLKLYRVIPK